MEESIKSSEGCSCRVFFRSSAIIDLDLRWEYHRSSARIPFPSPAYFAAALELHHSMVLPFPSLCGEPMHDAGEKETPPSDRHVVVRKPLLPAPCVRSVSLRASENPLPPPAVLRSRSRLAIGSENLFRVFPGLSRRIFVSPLISVANMRVADDARGILDRQSDR